MGRKKLILIFWTWLFAIALHAGTYTLLDGQTASGEAISGDKNGIVLRDGSTRRFAWNQFTQEALHQLKAERPQDADFIDPFLAENQQPEASKDIVLKPVDRVELPKGRTGLLAGLGSPFGFLIFLVLYGANLFAAREIAVFKNFKLPLVCGVSAAAPIIGPIVFLCLRALPEPEDVVEAALPAENETIATPETAAAETAEPSAPAQTPVAPQPPTSARPPTQPKFKTQFMSGKKEPAQTEAEPQPEATAATPEAATTFKRGQFTFNRRFFETKMPGFLRIVPSEAEKQTALYIKSARGEFIGQRISKITAMELYLEVFKENATAEEKIPFNEIYEVQLRPKDSV